MSTYDALSALARVLALAPRRATSLVLLLMLITGLTEGIGIVLLVPLLNAMVPTTADHKASSLVTWLDWLGLGQSVGPVLLLILALVFLRTMLVYWQQLQTSRLVNHVVDTLRDQCFYAVMHAEWRWLVQQRAASFNSMIITNVTRIGHGLQQSTNLIASSVSAMAFVAAALVLDWKLALVAMAGGAVLLQLVSGHRHRMIRLGQALGIANQALHQQVQEGVAGIRLTRIWQGEATAIRHFSDVVGHLRQLQLDYQIHLGRGRAGLQVGGAALLIVVIYIGLEILALSPAVLLPLALVFVRLVPMLGNVQTAWHQWLHSIPALTDTEALLADAGAVAEAQHQPGEPPIPLGNELRLEGITVTYATRDNPSLDRFDAIIKARTTTVITGPSGAGKSTLADVLTGLISPTAGTMSVDGIAIRGAMRQRWRQSVSYVQQDCFLFNESIRASLLRANSGASEAAMIEALRLAAADFAFDLPEGLDSQVGDNGVRLSGGERQRIALAGALLRQPSLLILDEATSAIDHFNELAIQRAIAKLRGRMTIIAIAHRGFRDMDADQILTLVAPDAAK